MTIGRARPPDEASARLAQLTARHDQALAHILDELHRHASNRQLTDALLDLRNILNPPERTRP